MTNTTELTPAPVFDVTAFEATDTAVLIVQNKKDDGPLLVNDKPVRIELYGPGSKQYLSAQHKIEQHNQAITFAGIRGKPIKETAEDKAEKRVNKLVACTLSIDNFPIAPKDLYSNTKLGYIADQVEKFIGDWSNF